MVGFKVEEVGKKENGEVIKRLRMRIVVEHEDIIRDGFWTAHPYILSVARSKQQQAHPPSPAAKPQLSLSLRWMLQISGYFYKACSWTELNTCIINTTWCPPDQNLCVGLATRVLYRCSARVLVNNAISGFASMELWVFLWNSLASVKIWWDLIAVKDCETQSNHRHACYATHSQYLNNIVQKCFPWIGL